MTLVKSALKLSYAAVKADAASPVQPPIMVPCDEVSRACCARTSSTASCSWPAAVAIAARSTEVSPAIGDSPLVVVARLNDHLPGRLLTRRIRRGMVPPPIRHNDRHH